MKRFIVVRPNGDHFIVDGGFDTHLQAAEAAIKGARDVAPYGVRVSVYELKAQYLGNITVERVTETLEDAAQAATVGENGQA